MAVLFSFIRSLSAITSAAVKSRQRWNPSSTEKEKSLQPMNTKSPPTQGEGKVSSRIPMCIGKAVWDLQSIRQSSEMR